MYKRICPVCQARTTFREESKKPYREMRIVEFQSFSARIATVARIVWIPAGVNLFSQLARRLSSDRETTSGLKPVDRLDVERSSSNQQAVWKLGMAASAVNNSQAGAKPAMLFCTCGVCRYAVVVPNWRQRTQRCELDWRISTRKGTT